MNHDQLIKGTSTVALYSTIALFYWVFVFLIITAFDLKIFREYITEIFYLSLVGIFAILGSAVVLNVMSNLSKISAVMSEERKHTISSSRPSRIAIISIALSFPLICAILFAGDHLSAEKKKTMLISSAETLISQNQRELAALAEYQFSGDYVRKAEKTLSVIKKIDKFFPEVMLIQIDNIDNKKVYLGFGGHKYRDEKRPVDKTMFIYSASKGERAYFESVFSGKEEKYKFSSHKGNYELYFPTSINGKRMVLYFSDYQRYGKFGS